MGIRIYELARQLGIDNKTLIEKFRRLKVNVKGHMSSVDDSAVEKLKKEIKPIKKEKKKTVVKTPAIKVGRVKKKAKKVTANTAEKKPQLPEKKSIKTEVALKEEHPEKPVTPEPGKTVTVDFPVNVKTLALKIDVKPGDIIRKLMGKGIFANINQNIQDELAIEIALNFDVLLETAPTMEDELLKHHKEESTEKLHVAHRSPVVTFMGHVDHGKTSLLDFVRSSRITHKEKGGITQHIGAYQVKTTKGTITFLDTPGHKAFTAMRARGANITDIVILVVAANDGVMPQTREAIDHARAAGVPIVVAINKCDLPSANPDKVKRDLQQLDLTPEDWGGNTITVNVSAKTGEGIENLLEMLLLEAELLELKANDDLRARGVVIESKMTPGQGIVTTLLVKNGTLKLGDVIFTGLYYGKAKAMIGDRRERMSSAGPSVPVEVLGLTGVPVIGDEFFVVKDEKKARILSQLKQQDHREQGLAGSQRMKLEDLHNKIQSGMKKLKLIIKSDVQGSMEALCASLMQLETDEIKLNVTHSDVGNVNESDVMLAMVANAIIIAFHVKIEPAADALAKSERVDIQKYDIIYKVIDDVRDAMEGLLEPIEKEVFEGRAVVRQVFKVSKTGKIAGCMVAKGRILRSSKVKVIRDKEEIWRGRIDSLKRFKNDVKDVQEGFECGISLVGFQNFREGDIIEGFGIEKILRKLNEKTQ